jgi:hypothetical protein
MKAPLVATAFGLVVIGVLLPSVREELPETRLTGGLELSLAADRKSVAPGETVTLTSTVRNLTDQQIPFHIGWGDESYFDMGWGLHRVAEKPGNRQVLIKPLNPDGSRFNLVYREPTHDIIKPHESVSWKTKLHLNYSAGQSTFLVGNYRLGHLDLHGAMCRLRWVYALDETETKRTWELVCKFRQSDAKYSRCWSGTLKSNDVWILVQPPVEPGVKAQ